MIESVIFSRSCGQGYVADCATDYLTLPDFRAVPVRVAGRIISPGEETNLMGHFSCQFIYLGLVKKQEMLFWFGSEADLFVERHFYRSVHLITEIRIFSMYTWQGGRDFHWKEGKWK